jgi:hypothetical protein
MTQPSDTADFRFTGKDVDKLTKALSEIAHLMSKEEWGLLLSIFAAAADNVELDKNKEGMFPGVTVDGGVIEDPKDKGVEALRKQLEKAYMPANKPRGGPLRDMVSPPKDPSPPKTPATPPPTPPAGQ